MQFRRLQRLRFLGLDGQMIASYPDIYSIWAGGMWQYDLSNEYPVADLTDDMIDAPLEHVPSRNC